MRAAEHGTPEHSSRIIQTVLIPTLLVSGLIGVWIAANDGWLRAVAPSHAYGLLAFAVIDILLALVVLVAPKPAYLGALLVSMIQIFAMAEDALTFTPAGTLQAVFRAYLLSDVAFVALLGIQLAVAGITATVITLPHGTGHRFHSNQSKHHKMLR
ncbi:MAG TPA: hypothetical protein VGS11_05750 [Candidatus Bathyarchaeia archaeon]|nr:hypothetical protein [Candidatus Bathyarchaeia archaeon]